MNNEDMSEMIQKLSSMINNSNNNDSTNNSDNNDISSNSNETSFENLQAIISNMNFNSITMIVITIITKMKIAIIILI